MLISRLLPACCTITLLGEVTAPLYTLQYSTVQYSTVQYSTVKYSTVQYSTVQYSTVQYIILRCPVNSPSLQTNTICATTKPFFNNFLNNFRTALCSAILKCKALENPVQLYNCSCLAIPQCLAELSSCSPDHRLVTLTILETRAANSSSVFTIIEKGPHTRAFSRSVKEQVGIFNHAKAL